MSDEVQIRVRYSETDKMGYVYYARYLEYFEMARTEYIRKRGKSYSEIEKEGYLLPVHEVWVKYKKPAHYDDFLTIETQLSSVGKASLKFQYLVHNEEGEIIAEGMTKLALLNKEGKIVPFPEEIRQKLLLTT